jgi:IS5 family transposase
VFGRPQGQMALFILTIDVGRAETKIALANPAYDIDRVIFQRMAAMG